MKRFKYLNGGEPLPKIPVKADATYVAPVKKRLPTTTETAFDKVNNKHKVQKAFNPPKFNKGIFNTGGIIESQTKKDPFVKYGLTLPGFTGSTTASPEVTTNTGGNTNFNLANIAPFMDNFANLVATNRTPKIPDPILTPAPALQTTVNVNPQLRKIENDTTAFNKGVDMSTSSAGVANANKGKALADKFRAIGDVRANQQNLETQLKNQGAMATFQARSANNALLNQKNQQEMMRTDDINQRYASVVSDFGTDISNINREKNLEKLDNERLKFLMKVNPDAVYQFADTDTFKELYKNDEPGLRRLISAQKGTATKATLTKLYKTIFNKDYID